MFTRKIAYARLDKNKTKKQQRRHRKIKRILNYTETETRKEKSVMVVNGIYST